MDESLSLCNPLPRLLYAAEWNQAREKKYNFWADWERGWNGRTEQGLGADCSGFEVGEALVEVMLGVLVV